MSRTGAAALVVFVASLGCDARKPVVDLGSRPAGVGGTIAGTVTAAGSGEPLSGRRIAAIDVKTGARFDTSTASNGGYTIKVPIGRYRLEVELRAGESLVEQPADTDINASDLDADRDFTITVRPR